MSDVKKTTAKANEEVIVIQMDTVAFLDAQFGILPDRQGKMLSDNTKKIAFWAYRKTPEVDQAILEWTGRQRLSTKLISNFREKQLIYRQQKVKLERGE